MAAHIAKLHSNTIAWNCKQCDPRGCVNYKDNLELLRHQLLHHYEGLFRCTYDNCEETTKTRYEAVVHYDRDHGGNILHVITNDNQEKLEEDGY